MAKLDIGPYDNILAFAEHSGRLDQIFGIFETLFHAKSINDKPVFVSSSTSIEWLLPPGCHRIKIEDKSLEYLKNLSCGLIPLGKPCDGVKTSGLKWNLDGTQVLAFGHLVSTSNKLDSETVCVDTSENLLITIEL